jgi:hypothetical protein
MKRNKIDLVRTRKNIKTLATNHPAISKLALGNIEELDEPKILKLALKISVAAKIDLQTFIILEQEF